MANFFTFLTLTLVLCVFQTTLGVPIMRQNRGVLLGSIKKLKIFEFLLISDRNQRQRTEPLFQLQL